MKKNILAFIHLSDIHFTKCSGDEYDVDLELRDAMLMDLNSNAKNTLESLSGVLVCGDLAFSGKQEEFDNARKFLEQVTQDFGISLKDVFCVAGNHDVDQSVIKSSRILECMQDEVLKIAREKPTNLDAELRKIQNDDIIKGLLYRHLNTYNRCVEDMSSNYSVTYPTWSSALELDNKYTLEIVGLNSVLISSHKDHLDENGNWIANSERQMVINRRQIPNRKENVIYLSLCHHPPECWVNAELQKIMDERVALQLYGHKHIQKIDENEKRIRISSGALHPERGDDWQPRYNWLEIWVENERLYVKIYPRVFNDIEGRFTPDSSSCDEGKEYHQIQMKISDEHLEEKIQDKREEQHFRDSEEISSEDKSTRNTNVYTKEIVYRFLILPTEKKSKLLREFREVQFKQGDDVAILLQELRDIGKEHSFLEKLRTIS